MEEKKHSVKVNIFGEDYIIKGTADSDYIGRVAEYLDRKMRIVSEGLVNRSHGRVAVLAALNIADELFRERGEADNTVAAMEERLEEFCGKLDHCLDSD